jgi:hypothetical protein
MAELLMAKLAKAHKERQALVDEIEDITRMMPSFKKKDRKNMLAS